MAQQLTLAASSRQQTGTGSARTLRRAGQPLNGLTTCHYRCFHRLWKLVNWDFASKQLG